MKPTHLRPLLRLIGGVQLILGALYLLVPGQLLHWMGHSPAAPDLAYPLAMLAARFLVYGSLLLIAARNPEQNTLLLQGMMWIQIIDLAAGLYYTGNGIVSLALSGFPMFNAAVFAVLLGWWQPGRTRAAC